MALPKSYLISLQDHITSLFEWIKELKTSKARSERLIMGEVISLPFNYRPFVELMLDEVFNHADHSQGLYWRPISILMEEGLTHTDAEMICSNFYTTLISYIATYFPDIKFSEIEKYQYGFCNDVDVLVTIPAES